MVSQPINPDVELEHLYILWDKRHQASLLLDRHQDDSDIVTAYERAQEEQAEQMRRLARIVRDHDLEHDAVMGMARRVWRNSDFLDYIREGIKG